MASYALLNIFSGFEYDMTRGHIGFTPINRGDFRCLWSVGDTWGDFILSDTGAELIVKGEAVSLCSLRIPSGERAACVEIDGRRADYTLDGDVIRLEGGRIDRSLTVRFA